MIFLCSELGSMRNFSVFITWFYYHSLFKPDREVSEFSDFSFIAIDRWSYDVISKSQYHRFDCRYTCGDRSRQWYRDVIRRLIIRTDANDGNTVSMPSFRCIIDHSDVPVIWHGRWDVKNDHISFRMRKNARLSLLRLYQKRHITIKCRMTSDMIIPRSG